MGVKIHREGANIIFALLLILVVICMSAFRFVRPITIPGVLTVGSFVVFMLVLNFFRSPRRNFKGDRKNVVVSSADGKVVALEEVYEDEFLHGKAIQLSVFMSVFNVHANWFPVDGKVLESKHHAGRFRAAYLPKSSLENEHSSILILTDSGDRILVRQIAGAIARRIVTYAHKGGKANLSKHLGFIKFGSRVDIFLPLDAEILVKIGDKTMGGITPIANLKNLDKNENSASDKK